MESRLRGPGGRTGLRGRASECALLDGLVSAVRRGESRSLVLRGEAGIGKTALLEYLTASASDLTVVRAVGGQPLVPSTDTGQAFTHERTQLQGRERVVASKQAEMARVIEGARLEAEATLDGARCRADADTQAAERTLAEAHAEAAAIRRTPAGDGDAQPCTVARPRVIQAT